MIKKVLSYISIFFVVLFFSFKGNKQNNNQIFAEILNKDTIKDGDIIKVKITNNSDEDFCFLLDTLSNKLINPIPNDISLMKIHFFKLYDKNYFQLIYKCSFDCEFNKKIINNIKRVNYKKTINNLIKIKAKSSFIFKKKFQFQNYFSEYCCGNYMVKNRDEVNYNLRFQLTYIDDYLTQPMKDSIHSLGYKIYKDTLRSNFKPIIIKVKNKKHLIAEKKEEEYNWDIMKDSLEQKPTEIIEIKDSKKSKKQRKKRIIDIP